MASQPILRYFEYDHLTGARREVSAVFWAVAHDAVDRLPNSPETSAGLRKLLEAKDCFVRSAMDLAA
jgi:hypothetical protein